MPVDTPVVSVVVSAFNAARTVREAIESIRRQTFEDWELVFIDDGSTDGTYEVVAALWEPRVRIVRGERRARSCGQA